MLIAYRGLAGHRRRVPGARVEGGQQRRHRAGVARDGRLDLAAIERLAAAGRARRSARARRSTRRSETAEAREPLQAGADLGGITLWV